MEQMNCGVYPTMITPYANNGEIDYDAVKRIVDWYIEKGCDGVFAVCQSSEMNFLSLNERVKLADTIVKHVKGRIKVVASGHCSLSINEQVNEINAISAVGIDAFILVSNRLDIHNDGDDVWIANAEKLLNGIDNCIDLGIYECPTPHKRLLSEKIIKWCISTGRFKFIKDTCCDPDMLKQRLELLRGTQIKLFNANAQTLLYSLNNGAAGYSGVMANFHPELYVWLCKNFKSELKKSEVLQSFLCMYAFSESMLYPVSAKYRLNFEGVNMKIDSRWKDKKEFSSYEKLVVEQGVKLEKYISNMLN